MNPMTIGTDCVTKEFDEWNSVTRSMGLYFRGLYYLWGGYRGADGVLYNCDSGDSKSTCQATMGESPKRSSFGIFDTDYDNYQIDYFCRSYLRYFKYEYFAVYSRTPMMSNNAMIAAKNAILNKIPQYNLDNAGLGLYWTKQEGCQYDWKFD